VIDGIRLIIELLDHLVIGFAQAVFPEVATKNSA
jgi:hypothetical protein